MYEESILVDCTVGDRVRNLRLRQGLSLRKLALRAGVSPAYLSKLETGGSERPGNPNLQRLARALGVDVDYLVGDLSTPTADDLPLDLQAAIRSLPPELRDAVARLVEEAASVPPIPDRRNQIIQGIDIMVRYLQSVAAEERKRLDGV